MQTSRLCGSCHDILERRLSLHPKSLTLSYLTFRPGVVSETGYNHYKKMVLRKPFRLQQTIITSKCGADGLLWLIRGVPFFLYGIMGPPNPFL